MNNCTLMGRLGVDPQMRYFESGKCVAQFNLAVSGRNNSTMWIQCKAWGLTGEAIAKHFSKGKQIAVVGELEQENWQDRESGGNRSKHIINVRSFSFCGSKTESSSEQHEYDEF